MDIRINVYALRARYIPAIFTIIFPIMVFNHFFASEELSKLIGDVFGAKIVSNITISGVCLFFLSEAGRFLGKNIFERIYFKDENRMPTTTFLLFKDNTYSADYKNKVHKKVFKDFKIVLPTAEDETSDERLARTKIVETMALIRKKLYGNKFLLQHNIEYGAVRNAIGGAMLGTILSVINVLFFLYAVSVPLAVHISIVSLTVYLFLIAFSKVIISFYGNNYAKVLFREYMG